jgi:thiol-disulfide isomerase/thioredoxin
MTRSWAVALLVLLPAVSAAQVVGDKNTVTIQGKLAVDDPKDAKRNQPSKTHLVRMFGGKVYTIDMVSTQFDSYLRLEDAKGMQLDEDDDSGGNLNARIVFNCSKDGEYKVICTTFNGKVGNYTLTVKESVQTVKPGASHQGLVGKAAPDFHADFAVNGKGGMLSDLKGKVVLLAFWEIQSGPCAATFPRLRGWHKAHHAEGLAIVGLTFYNFEIGQKLTLDRDTGQLTRIARASKETEQALLRDFARHHLLDYLLLVQRRADAVATFDAYVVNGLPQFVLIDRAGIVRMVRVGEDEATAAALESEFKKLLVEE